jgi:hypothetical protein
MQNFFALLCQSVDTATEAGRSTSSFSNDPVADGNVSRGFADLATWLAEHLRVESALMDGEIAGQ